MVLTRSRSAEQVRPPLPADVADEPTPFPLPRQFAPAKASNSRGRLSKNAPTNSVRQFLANIRRELEELEGLACTAPKPSEPLYDKRMTEFRRKLEDPETVGYLKQEDSIKKARMSDGTKAQTMEINLKAFEAHWACY